MRVLGSKAHRQWFIDHVLALRDGDKVIDIGCGTGDVLARLPRVEYVGCDVSEAYLKAAHRNYGNRGLFLSGTVEDWARDPRTSGADLVLASGVLHHVDDKDAVKLLQFARDALKPCGRFVFYEPCYLIWQSRLSSFFMSRDRGQNIRHEQEWKNLIAGVFKRFTTNIATNTNRLFYVIIIGQCYKDND